MNYKDKKNYLLFGVDKRDFERRVVSNGKEGAKHRTPHQLDPKQVASFVVELSGKKVRHLVGGPSAGYSNARLQNFKVLDTWNPGQGRLSAGRFGFYIENNRELRIKDFQFRPK